MVIKKNLAFIALILLGVILRLIPMTQSWWLDEAINVRAAVRYSIPELFGSYATGDFHPPLYHLFLHLAVTLLPPTEFVSRLPSLIADIGIMILIYKLASKHSKMFALALSVNNGLLMYYANEARMYTMAAFGVMLVFSLLFSKKHHFRLGIDRSLLWQTLPKTLLIAASIWFALSFDYLPWLLLPVWLVLAPIATLIAGVGLLVWAPLLIQQLSNGLSVASEFPGWSQVVGGFSLKAVVLVPIKFLLGRISPSPDWVYFLWAVIPILIAGYGMLRLVRMRRQPRTWILIAWVLVPTTLAILISPFISVLSYFRLLFVVPAVILLVADGLLSKPQFRHKLAASILIVLTTGAGWWYVIDSRWHREDWRTLAAYIDNSATATVVIMPNLAQADPLLIYSKTSIVESVTMVPAYHDVVYVAYLEDIFDPNGTIRTALTSAGYELTQEVRPRGLVAYRYTMIPTLASQ